MASLPALVAFALLAWRFRFTCDDAFITFRYSRHLAEGAGLRFNPGETPPVEGYTNFLWTVLLALPERLGWSVGACANLVSTGCGAALILVTAGFAAGRLRLPAPGVAAVALFLATLPAVAVWATGGLETMPFALAVFGTFAALAGARQRPLVALCAACAAVLLRADGFGFVGLALGAAVLAGAPLRGVLSTAGSAALAAGLHFLWRHGYYGQWVPNTARVKAGLSAARAARGWGYLASQLLAMPSLLLVACAGLGRLRAAEEGARRIAWGALAFLLANAAYAVFVGGDFMAMGRFLAPSMPFAALALAALLAGGRAGDGTGPRSAASGLVPAALLVALNLLACFDRLGVPDAWRQAVHFRWNTDVARSEVDQWASMKANGDELALLGQALAEVVEPGQSMIRSSVGGVGYFTELWLFDRNGLVSPEVVDGSEPLERASPGHDRRVEPDFFFPRRPTYYGAKLVGGPFGRGGLGPGAQELARAGALEVRRTPLSSGLLAAAGLPQGIELQLLVLGGERR